MKKILIIIVSMLFIFSSKVYAVQEAQIILNDMNIQNRISEIGLKLLNANKIDKRIVFAYTKDDKLIKGEPSLTKRQIVIYKEGLKYVTDDNELAGMLSREICKALESYLGPVRGFVGSAQIKAAPKKYEIFFDKRAVDLMVMAGYNPIGLITYINKSAPQKRYDIFSSHNLTSKRLAYIYEYIYTKYPIFLKENEYINTQAYQNFLLTSMENRKKFQDKTEKGYKNELKYE